MIEFEWLSSSDKQDLIRLMTKVGGRRTAFLYELFDSLNEKFFDNGLPTPLITSEITPYGGCLGLTAMGGESTIPHIRINSAMCGRDGSINPKAWKGTLEPHSVYTLMIHEMTHVSQQMEHLRTLTGESSHNARNWVVEANRMSEAWDLPRCCRRWTKQRVEGKVSRRVGDLKEPTADTVVEGLTMDHVSRWPHGVAEVVHRDLPGWSASCVKRLDLPRF